MFDDIILKNNIHKSTAISETKLFREAINSRRDERSYNELIAIIEEMKERKGYVVMSENMFEVRNKESRRKQFIENLDVADEIINTNPNVTMFKNEENIKEPENVDTSEIDNEETDKNRKNRGFNFSLYKKEKIRKKVISYLFRKKQ